MIGKLSSNIKLIFISEIQNENSQGPWSGRGGGAKDQISSFKVVKGLQEIASQHICLIEVKNVSIFLR